MKNDEGEGWGNGLKERGYQVSFPEKEGGFRERGGLFDWGRGRSRGFTVQ